MGPPPVILLALEGEEDILPHAGVFHTLFRIILQFCHRFNGVFVIIRGGCVEKAAAASFRFAYFICITCYYAGYKDWILKKKSGADNLPQIFN